MKDEEKKPDYTYQFTIKGKHLNIPPILTYPHSGLSPNKTYTVTIKEEEQP